MTSKKEETAQAQHAEVPADARGKPPTDDGLNTMGYFRRPTEDGGSEVVKLPATENAIAGYVAKGFILEGFCPA